MSDAPLAYFITFRTYGTWLQGDSRESTDRWHNRYGEPSAPSSSAREGYHRDLMCGDAVVLTTGQRAIVDRGVRSRCEERGWGVLAANVRTNHVHVVVSASAPAEVVMGNLKAAATQSLTGLGEFARGAKVWSRGGSTRYLWTERDIEGAWEYVVNGQDEKPGREHE